MTPACNTHSSCPSYGPLYPQVKPIPWKDSVHSHGSVSPHHKAGAPPCPCGEDGDPTHTGIVAAWLSPCTGNSWGRVADLGKAVVLFSAISLVGVAGRKQEMVLLTHKYFPPTSAKERTKA